MRGWSTRKRRREREVVGGCRVKRPNTIKGALRLRAPSPCPGDRLATLSGPVAAWPRFRRRFVNADTREASPPSPRAQPETTTHDTVPYPRQVCACRGGPTTPGSLRLNSFLLLHLQPCMKSPRWCSPLAGEVGTVRLEFRSVRWTTPAVPLCLVETLLFETRRSY